MLAESALLAVAGGVAGLIAAWWLMPVLVSLAPARLPRIGPGRRRSARADLRGDRQRHDDDPLRRRAVAAGFVQPSRSTRCDRAEAWPGSAAARSASSSSCQVALAVVLLAGAALLGETCRPSHVAAGRLRRRGSARGRRGAAARSRLRHASPRTGGWRAARAHSRAARRRVRGRDGVTAVRHELRLEQHRGDRTARRVAAVRSATSSVRVSSTRWDADAARPRVRAPATPRGRSSSPRRLATESPDSLGVAIVSQELERRYFGGNATGQRIRFNRMWLDVIGVAPDAKSRQYTDEAAPAFYVYTKQMPYIAVGQFVVRASGDPTTTRAALREVVTSGDSRLPSPTSTPCGR